MTLSMQSALDYTLPDLAALLDRAFTGYLVPMHFTAAGLASTLPSDSIQLHLSRVILRDDQPTGVALIARRGWTIRLAAMGIVPEGRGQRIGEWAMGQLLDEARGRGERSMVLEVIEQNTAAVRLYERVGFTKRRRLVGLTAHQPVIAPAPAPEEVDIREVATAITRYGLPDLPWQFSGESLALFGPPARGYKLGPAYAFISDPAQERISLRSLVVPPEARRQGHATALLKGLFALFLEKTWAIPAIMPEELAFPALERLGFVRESLSQFQMERAV